MRLPDRADLLIEPDRFRQVIAGVDLHVSIFVEHVASLSSDTALADPTGSL
jgi:hypothetical protein